MTARQLAMAQAPDFPWLSSETLDALTAVLQRAEVAKDGNLTVTQAESAGSGNMNLTLRVTVTDSSANAQRTLIVKQSRPWVEKYDVIAAPWDRALIEAAFYARVRKLPGVSQQMPALLGVDTLSRTLVLEDLGSGADLSSIYSDNRLPRESVMEMARYLCHLHSATRDRYTPQLANREMRQLNHAHIFQIPLDAPDAEKLDHYEPGLGERAVELSQCQSYRREVQLLADRYLSDGACLLHGDFFPGSWLKTDHRLYVIDPEFCFFGDAEFDVGVAIAHLALARVDLATAEAFLTAYECELDLNLAARFAAVEVMRRLIGVAQLPLPAQHPRVALLSASARAMETASWKDLWL